jgi:hypothetical protein
MQLTITTAAPPGWSGRAHAGRGSPCLRRRQARNEISSADRAALRALVLSMLWGLSIVGVDRPEVRTASVRAFRLLFRNSLLR